MKPGIKSSRPSHVNGPFSTASTILAVFMFAGADHAQSAFVRVNQTGYVSGGSKRAYLMASGSEGGATFVLKNSSGGTVFGPAAIGANLGSWSGSYPDVYPLDFDSFTAGGTYSISVSGPIAALSPDFNMTPLRTSTRRLSLTRSSFTRMNVTAPTLSLRPYVLLLAIAMMQAPRCI